MFYSNWQKDVDNNCYWESYLRRSEESINPFVSYDSNKLGSIIEFLLSIPLEKFVEKISLLGCSGSSLETSDIFQFSSLEASSKGVCKVLSNHGKSSQEEIGSFFPSNKQNKVAQRKFGGEQANMSLRLLLTRSCKEGGRRLYELSSFGEFFLEMGENDKSEILKRVFLSEKMPQVLIFEAMRTREVKLADVFVGCLSSTTIVRRISAAKTVMNFILSDSSYAFLLNNFK